MWYHKPLDWGGRDPVISQAFTLRRKRPCDITSLYTEEEETLWYHKLLHWGGRDPVISQAWGGRDPVISQAWGGRDPVISQAFTLKRKRPCDITSLYTEEEETLWYHKPLHWWGRDPVISQAFTLRRKRPCDITSLYTEEEETLWYHKPEEEETLWYHKPLHWGGRDSVLDVRRRVLSGSS